MGDISGTNGEEINSVAICGGFTHLQPYMHWTMKVPEVPPLLVRASDQSPEKIAGGLSKFSRWSEIGADPWVMRIVQWGYRIPFVTLPPLRLQEHETTYPKGSLEWSSLNQSVQERRNKGAIEPAPLTPGFTMFTAACSLFARQQGSGGRS